MRTRLSFPLLRAALLLALATPLAAAPPAASFQLPTPGPIPPVLTRVASEPAPPVRVAPIGRGPITLTPAQRPNKPPARADLLKSVTANAQVKAALDARSAEPGGTRDYLNLRAVTDFTSPQAAFVAGVTLTPVEPVATGPGWSARMALYSVLLEASSGQLDLIRATGVVTLYRSGEDADFIHLVVEFPGAGATPSPYSITIGIVPTVTADHLSAADFTLNATAGDKTVAVPLGDLPDGKGLIALVDAPPGRVSFSLVSKQSGAPAYKFSYVQVLKI